MWVIRKKYVVGCGVVALECVVHVLYTKPSSIQTGGSCSLKPDGFGDMIQSLASGQHEFWEFITYRSILLEIIGTHHSRRRIISRSCSFTDKKCSNNYCTEMWCSHFFVDQIQREGNSIFQAYQTGHITNTAHLALYYDFTTASWLHSPCSPVHFRTYNLFLAGSIHWRASTKISYIFYVTVIGVPPTLGYYQFQNEDVTNQWNQAVPTHK